MKKVKIEMQTKKEDKSLVKWEGEVELPESLSEAVQLYGEEACGNLLVSQIQTNKMNIGRVALREGKDVVAAMAAYVPGQKRERTPTDPTQTILTNFGKMDVEARKALIAQLRAQLAG